MIESHRHRIQHRFELNMIRYGGKSFDLIQKLD